jgi:hypothetical protein
VDGISEKREFCDRTGSDACPLPFFRFLLASHLLELDYPMFLAQNAAFSCSTFCLCRHGFLRWIIAGVTIVEVEMRMRENPWLTPAYA